jgi:hypothetical protein
MTTIARFRAVAAAIGALALVGTGVVSAAAPAAASASGAGAVAAPAAVTIAYPYTCRSIDVGVGQFTVSTTITLTASVPASVPRGGTVVLTGVSITLGSDVAYDLPSFGGLTNTEVSGLLVTVGADGGTTPATVTTTDDLDGEVTGPNGYTSPTTSLSFSVTGDAGTPITFRPEEIDFLTSNVVYWDSIGDYYTCHPTSDTPLGTTTVVDPLVGQVGSVASDLQHKLPGLAQLLLVGSAIDDLEAPGTGAVDRLGAGDELGASGELGAAALALQTANTVGSTSVAGDAAVVTQILNELATREVTIAGEVTGCATSAPSCSSGDLAGYQTAVLRLQAGVTYQVKGKPAGAVIAFTGAVSAAVALGG